MSNVRDDGGKDPGPSAAPPTMSKTRILSKTIMLSKSDSGTKHGSARKAGIVITGKTEELLRQRARFLGTTADELAKRVIDQYLKENADDTIQPDDARFKKAAEDILRRHSDLYKRLTK
jgi:hypothetical protein